ncbi:exported hypothetical protein [metagenome]|uniref:Uncharacterized protein n=1 Tax=metagenome TaxID=256318 RepID=A0A2P2C705_9ZZZZ
MSRRVGYAMLWLLAVVLAVSVGVAAVSTVGASIRGRGLLGASAGSDVGNESIRTDQLGEPSVSPAGPTTGRDSITGEWGSFQVECRGVYAVGVKAVPAPGWRVVSYETGPDDDVDAVFSKAARSVDLEVFCNRGEPTVAEIERNTLPDND